MKRVSVAAHASLKMDNQTINSRNHDYNYNGKRYTEDI